MNRCTTPRGLLSFLTLTICLGSALAARSAAAEEPLTGPSLETQGKPMNAPAPTDGPAPKLGGISLLVGAVVADMGPLNHRLADNRAAFPNDVPSAFPMFGGQGYGLVGRFLIGGSGAAIFSRTVDAAADRKISVGGGWGSFDFGYQVLRVNGFLIAPVLSLGGYTTNVTVAQKGKVDFNTALTTNRSTSMSDDGFLAGLSIMANTVILGRGAQVPGARTGWTLGLRVGALYGIPLRGFREDGYDITGEPTLGLRGGYAALSIGLGGQ
ncbi:MAG: hypothetical protein ABUL62_10580 [Myxococcales bacterium]|jgi:hypothetical protein